MDIAQKLAYLDRHLESVATHDDADAAVLQAALNRVIERATAFKAVIQARVDDEIALQLSGED